MKALNLMLMTAGAPATFDLEQFLVNATAKVKDWGGLLFILMGAVLLLIAIIKIVSGLISHGKKPVNWVVCVIMLILGGALVSFGAGADAWGWVQNIAVGGKNTIDQLGGGGGGTGGGATPTIIHGL